MRIYLEITELENGDIVLREARDEEDESRERPDGPTTQALAEEPLLRIRFSNQVRDMLGGDLVEVAEAMIDAATEFMGGLDEESVDAGESGGGGLQAGSLLAGSKSPIIH